VALWIEESQLEGVDLKNEDDVRLKTTQCGPFIESIIKLDAQTSTVCNFSGGEKVGGSWTDKVFTVKSGLLSGASNNSKENEGAADDEWGD